MTKRRDGDDEPGIAPARVAQPAELVDARGTPVVRRSFGMPVGVSRLVDLPRAPTDREWGQLVSEFRTMFGVQGRETTSGGLREWSHGNLHISVEPTARGEQLRLSTAKEDAVVINVLGFGLLAMSALMGTVVVVAGKPEKALAVAGVFGGLGVLAFFAATLFRQPLWARVRARQMGEIAEHAVRLLSNS